MQLLEITASILSHAHRPQSTPQGACSTILRDWNQLQAELVEILEKGDTIKVTRSEFLTLLGSIRDL